MIRARFVPRSSQVVRSPGSRAGLPVSLVAAVALALVVLAPAGARARSLADVTMPDTAVVDGTTLQLNGLGLREATVFKVDVYVAALYLEKKTKDAKEAMESEQVKRLVMHFVRAVGKSDLDKAFREGFEKGKVPMTDARIGQFLAGLGDVKVGDEVVFTYRPGKGVEMVFAGKPKGEMAGPDFAQALLNVYLGTVPPNPELKTGMLGAH